MQHFFGMQPFALTKTASISPGWNGVIWRAVYSERLDWSGVAGAAQTGAAYLSWGGAT
jgi:hypothetical protein